MIWILLILAIAIIALYGTPWAEHMTNADVKAKVATYQKQPETEMAPPKSTHKKADDKEAIRGPGVPPVADGPSGHKKPGKVEPSSGVYPDIYGPEKSLVPGGHDASGIIPSDIPTPPTFSAVMPNTPDVPRPFLNDFSKILNESPV